MESHPPNPPTTPYRSLSAHSPQLPLCRDPLPLQLRPCLPLHTRANGLCLQSLIKPAEELLILGDLHLHQGTVEDCVGQGAGPGLCHHYTGDPCTTKIGKILTSFHELRLAEVAFSDLEVLGMYNVHTTMVSGLVILELFCAGISSCKIFPLI